MNIAKEKENKVHGTESFPCSYYNHNPEQGQLEVKMHWHLENEIVHLIDGQFTVEINGERKVYEKGYLFINRDELHSISSNNGASEDAVIFRMEMLKFWEQTELQLKVIQPLVKGELKFSKFISEEKKEFHYIDKYYKNIVNCHNGLKTKNDGACGKVSTSQGNQLEIIGNLIAILGILMNNQLLIKADNHLVDKRIYNIKNAFTFIEKNYDMPISVGAIASEVGMNEQYFSRVFKEIVGIPPMEYVNIYRIKNAKHLLSSTNKTVTEIALECGFHNMGNFIRNFKKETKVTPKEYRKRS
ncbi:helix-turn-helix domain-containing protein [Anaerosacchariphilus polymeriproducens]|uniref:AraC family transcriptional regulator n=1 Tax=Anaerosacchariphilus polymeriproducens TaxID=1812858 RepID=A0A371AZB5_9FIRM|nr:AraC family transcriptional regulator [Anaerosacchariphilus polymeriproducens]RDU24889.1 AraC family transcriptional regulator [Anaerosacchariphilus polymeriproducens]